MTDKQLEETLLRQAEEISEEGHSGWGNTMILAAERLSALRSAQPPPATQSTDTSVESKYQELIYAVESKYPNETRHETALRYIRQAETQSLAAQQEGDK